MSSQSQAVPWLRARAIGLGALWLDLVLVGVTLPTPIWAGDSFHFAGPNARASFSSTDPTLCITTYVDDMATKGRVQDPPGPPTTSSNLLDLFIAQYDNCAGGVPTLYASGEATLPDEAFQVESRLTSATLNAIVQVFDFVTLSTFDVEVALTWTGSGELVRQSNTFIGPKSCNRRLSR